MKLSQITNIEFSKKLASDAPAPGGGSVAALSASLGAALTHMVAALTTGKSKYAEYEELTLNTLKQAEDLRVKLLDCMDRDTEIFAQMEAVFKMPKATDEEKSARREAMQAALKACSVVPLEIMGYSYEALVMTNDYVGKSNANASSDLGVAALMLGAGVRGAWLNVLINIGGIKDGAFVNEYREKGSELLEKSMKLADKIYEEVAGTL
ncbi:MAG: cyclodeaminase/cyclohydrolase family protein [Defluviitaleaceae bacterium]|nr:cyclodeaminase/cyclohydrolase family protein [Defluviitaleaceae bacterium]